jgi:hypothetical protein
VLGEQLQSHVLGALAHTDSGTVPLGSTITKQQNFINLLLEISNEIFGPIYHFFKVTLNMIMARGHPKDNGQVLVHSD